MDDPSSPTKVPTFAGRMKFVLSSIVTPNSSFSSVVASAGPTVSSSIAATKPRLDVAERIARSAVASYWTRMRPLSGVASSTFRAEEPGRGGMPSSPRSAFQKGWLGSLDRSDRTLARDQVARPPERAHLPVRDVVEGRLRRREDRRPRARRARDDEHLVDRPDDERRARRDEEVASPRRASRAREIVLDQRLPERDRRRLPRSAARAARDGGARPPTPPARPRAARRAVGTSCTRPPSRSRGCSPGARRGTRSARADRRRSA